MSSSLGYLSRTLTVGGGSDETHDSLAPLMDIPLPHFNSRNLEPFDGESDLMGSSSVFPEAGETLCDDLGLSFPSKLNPHLSKSTLKLFNSNSSFNYPSKYVNALLNLESLSVYFDFDGGYSVFSPFETNQMSKLGPWRRVSSSHVKTLNRLGLVSSEKLKAFHGSSIRYAPESFSDVEFLSSLCCKT